jgi:hypothetical protein
MNSNTSEPEIEVNPTDKNVDLEQRLREMKKLIDEQRLLQAELKQDLL